MSGNTVFTGASKIDADGIVDDFWMLVHGDTIVQVGTGDAPAAASVIDLSGRTITPGFIDLHCHGGGGHAFDDGDDDIVAALATHRAHGTTRSVISLVSNPIAMLRDSLETVADLVEEDPLILGSHLEGPYLADARRGAHHPDHLREADAIELESLIEAARGTLCQVTLAPERPGALDAIDRLVAAGVVVAVGHTEADHATAREAFQRGATLLTHAFNAMAGIHHREPGPIVAAYADERVTLELILDGVHVHPDVVRSAFLAAPGRIALVTDAMAATGENDGDYRLGELNVSVRGGRALLSGTTTIAGSTLTQDEALRCAVRDASIDPVAAVAALTATPAHVLGLGERLGRLAPGYAADLVVLDGWDVEQVWAAGRRL
ncbi:N-acetylglucosamine-6-phosphate deacetylase [Salinibacterium sp. SYSU T00001]|uniref:N-acetylglucosamine-6-phosphate deacetylase n=1 Tax=Homoserinimonas sedimenticola TaxID=2986805 RepID=UPI00223607CE|nr:N-acetylglucosamine-6-phosphate deacetylase [Salinibacterium sedimenticola]MCW4386060.1 N-acetylglucosamine-6-phosphate deacetylase [Salinibacterium sedimenticola]